LHPPAPRLPRQPLVPRDVRSDLPGNPLLSQMQRVVLAERRTASADRGQAHGAHSRVKFLVTSDAVCVKSALTVLTSDELQACWREFNSRYFNDVLSPIPIMWSPRLTSSAGLFITGRPRTPLRSSSLSSEHRLIRLSIPLLSNQPLAEVHSTLAHEMIHQWQYDVRKRKPDHGNDFRGMMSAMNRYGLSITVRHSLAGVRSLCRYTWHCLRCGKVYHRHRRTIRPARHRCGTCSGFLRELPAEN
jgi:predicted SprT family Zn-dependent metalloprotease